MGTSVLNQVGVDRTYWNAMFLIRYYPDSKDRHNTRLVGVDKFCEIVGKESVAANLMKMALEKSYHSEKVTCKLRRGIEFVFFLR